jgi:hypothetical protein
MKRTLIFLLLAVSVVFATNPHTPRAPIVVAEATYINQNLDLAQTTVFTPSSDGLYRITAYVEFVPTNSANTTNVLAFWTDNEKTKGANLSVAGNNGLFVPVTVYALAGTPISIETNGTSLASGSEYNLYVTVEQL